MMMGETKSIPVNRIIVAGDNPRQNFDEESLRRLGESIKSHGLIQPIVVRPKNGYYELVVGERRLRAVELMGMKEIEARIEELDDATTMELRLIENTQREDLTDAEKGDAVYSLMEHDPEKYPTIKEIADAINIPYGTVLAWTRKSRKLSDEVRTLVADAQIDEKAAGYLLKYNHDTQTKLGNMIAKNSLNQRQAIQLIKLYDENPEASLDNLANEVLGIKKVEIDVTKLSEEARKEVQEILKEKEERADDARERALEKARKTPRQPRPKRIEPKPEERVLEKAKRITEKLAELEPEQRKEISEAVEGRLDTLAKGIDKKTLEWMEKKELEIAPWMKEETPEEYAMKTEEILHGIWIRLWVEEPQSVKETWRNQMASALSTDRLERLLRTLRITVNELEDVLSTIESELYIRKSRTP
jgi:ParB family chromosome partitioning protein